MNAICASVGARTFSAITALTCVGTIWLHSPVSGDTGSTGILKLRAVGTIILRALGRSIRPIRE
jgi:hypothetical protein